MSLSAMCTASSPNTRDVSSGGHSHQDLRARVQLLPFAATIPPEHRMTVKVGVFFDHLYSVESFHHSYQADFWLAYRWHDPRNLSVLFHNNDQIESLEEVCTDKERQYKGRDDGQRRLDAQSHGASTRSRYIELDNDALHAFWHPDAHIRNLGDKGKTIIHSQLIRLFEDGTFEQLQLVFARLQMPEPYYGSYPFDQQVLTVHIESMAHTTKRIVFQPLANFSGMNTRNIPRWPGWTFAGLAFGSIDAAPDYVSLHENTHRPRCERRSRFFLNICVTRQYKHILTSLIIPLIIQVVITWTAFFVGIQQLMPRVAVAFVSYLSLNNAATALTSGLPPVSYVMFMDVFVLSQRLMVVVSLLETVCTWYITEYVSTQVALALDCFARVFVPVNYLVYNAILFAIGNSYVSGDEGAYEETLSLLEIFAWGNLCLVVLVGILWCLFKYWWLYRTMMMDPVKLHVQCVHSPLDKNEKSLLFRTFDTNRDGMVGVRHMVEVIINRLGRPELMKKYEEIVAAVLEKIPEKQQELDHDTLLDLEDFLVSQPKVFMTIAHFCQHVSSRLVRNTISIESEDTQSNTGKIFQSF